MSLTAIILAMAAQTVPGPVPKPLPQTDVAYQELVTGNSGAAVIKLEQSAESSADPALLINLGTAYAKQGATAKALAAFRAAIASPERYDLELADGTWMDSRDLARHALASLQRSSAQARR